jgi:type IV pilus assembly protein PilC
VQLLQRGDVDEALAATRALPEYWIPLLSVATTSGDAGQFLREFLKHSRVAGELRRQWSYAFLYPFLVASIATAVFILLSFTVIRSFDAIFSDFGLRLPDLTLFVLRMASWVRNGPVLVLLAVFLIGGAIFVLAFGRRWASVSGWIGESFGRFTSVAPVARFTADLLEAGLDAPSALAVAASVSRRASFRQAARQFAISLRGVHTAEKLDTRPLTSSVVYALRAEMPTSSRVRLLRALSDSYAERSGAMFSWSRGLAAPITICIVGLFVGVIVLALFIPLVSLVENLSGF